MSTPTTLATMADLEAHPGRCELINGEIIEMAPAGFEHGFAVANIARVLGIFVHANKKGRVLAGDPGFIIDEHTVRAPDVAFLDAEHARQAPARGFIPGVPQLAVEVVSPGDTYSEVVEKARMWVDHGVGLVWLADPRSRTVEIHAPGCAVVHMDEQGRIDGGDVLPGFSAAVVDFFA